MVSGYNIVEIDGRRHTVTLQRCEHTSCMRYCDDYSLVKYCDFCANLEGTDGFGHTICDGCAQESPKERDLSCKETIHSPRDSPPRTTRAHDKPQPMFGRAFHDYSPTQHRSPWDHTQDDEDNMPSSTPREDMIRGVMEALREVMDEDHEMIHTPPRIDETTRSNPPRVLTWCEGELWEGGCAHSLSEPEPFTNKDGIIIGHHAWNHDGTSSKYEYTKCGHTNCMRHYDPNKHERCCEECTRSSLMVKQPNAQGETTMCELCMTSMSQNPVAHHAMMAMGDNHEGGEQIHERAPRKRVSERDDEFILDEWDWADDITPSEASVSTGDERSQFEIEDIDTSSLQTQWDTTSSEDGVMDHTPTTTTSPNMRTTKWYAKCSTPNCACEASYNGQDGEACSRYCKLHKACTKNKHYFPTHPPPMDAPRQPGDYGADLMTSRLPTIRNRNQYPPPRITPKTYHHSYCGTRGDPRV